MRIFSIVHNVHVVAFALAATACVGHAQTPPQESSRQTVPEDTSQRAPARVPAPVPTASEPTAPRARDASANDTTTPSSTTTTTDGKVAPDNSRINQRDATVGLPTADEQPNLRGTLETIRSIRAAIVSDKSLSTYAHNIKIISEGNSVVLRGPVRSQNEKQRVEEIASKAAGAVAVRNNLDVVQTR